MLMQRQKDSIFNGTNYPAFLFGKLKFLFEAFSSILHCFVLRGTWNRLGLAKTWRERLFVFEAMKEFDVVLRCFDVILRIFELFLHVLNEQKICATPASRFGGLKK